MRLCRVYGEEDVSGVHQRYVTRSVLQPRPWWTTTLPLADGELRDLVQTTVIQLKRWRMQLKP